MVVTTALVQDNNSIEQIGDEDDQGAHTDRPRTLSGIRRNLLHTFQNSINRFYLSRPSVALGRRGPFPNFVGPDRQTTPYNDTVVWNLIFLVIHFTSLCLAARFPCWEVRTAFVSISTFVFIALSGLVSIDIVYHGVLKRSHPCLKIKAHNTTRRPQIQKKSRQHYTDCTPQHPLDDGIIFIFMVPATEQEAVGSQPRHRGQ